MDVPSSHLPPRRGMGYTNIFRRCDGGSPQATRLLLAVSCWYWLLTVRLPSGWQFSSSSSFSSALLITLNKHKTSTFSVFGVNDFSTGYGRFTAFRPPNSPPLQVKIEIKLLITEYWVHQQIIQRFAYQRFSANASWEVTQYSVISKDNDTTRMV